MLSRSTGDVGKYNLQHLFSCRWLESCREENFSLDLTAEGEVTATAVT